MWELLFVVTMAQGKITKEVWPDYFASQQKCEDTGWHRASGLRDQIMEKYPNLIDFNIECRKRNGIEV